MKTQNNSTTRSASVGMLYLFIFVLFGFCYWLGWSNCASQPKTPLQNDYTIRFIDPSGKLILTSKDTTYTTTLDSLIVVIEKDNL